MHGHLVLRRERRPNVSFHDYTGNALWQALPAVRADQVYRWGPEWYGATYHRYLDAVETIGSVLADADRDLVD